MTLLDCVYVFEELLATKNWQPKFKKYEKLFDAIKSLKASDEFVADGNLVV